VVAAVLIACLPLPAAAQSEEEKTRAQLQQLQRDIKRINSEISSASKRKNNLQQQLRQAEVRLGTLQREISENQRAMAANRKELSALEGRRPELERARDQQQARIALELKTAWQLGQQSQVKVLLSQESPHTLARAMAYYRYFFQARNELVSSYRETLQQLQELELRIAATLEQLENQQGTLEKQQQKLVAAQQNRAKAVASLSASIGNKAEKLQQLQQNQKELEGLLKAIEKAVVNLQVPDDYQAFKAARGKMPWPVAGKQSNRFGRPRNEGKMRWQGVTIPAREGTRVKAIHHGRVVYADWLRGSGLLLIIDHGDGYMSLYAHNQSLLREVGEWVTAGTPVSTVGSSGGQERAALYFEIRHQGKPADPAKWCKG
jgi:murein hydrolase activator